MWIERQVAQRILNQHEIAVFCRHAVFPKGIGEKVGDVVFGLAREANFEQ